jgi:hypothetical protein
MQRGEESFTSKMIFSSEIDLVAGSATKSGVHATPRVIVSREAGKQPTSKKRWIRRPLDVRR